MRQLSVRRVGSVLASVALVSCVAAQAASGQTVRLTAALAAISQSSGYPSAGSTAVYTGTVKSKLGRGAVIDSITITAKRSPTTYRFLGTSTGFYSHGTSKSRISGLMTVDPNGSVAFAGDGHYTGGSGSYRRVRGSYAFSGTTPAVSPLPQPTPCALPAGSTLVASDAQLVVAASAVSDYVQEIRYCNIAQASLGFRLLAQNNSAAELGGSTTITTVDGVAGANLLYHTGGTVDSPACGGVQIVSSAMDVLNTSSGATQQLWQGSGEITSASLAPTGVGAWLVDANNFFCEFGTNPARQESLDAYDPGTGAVTTLDTGDSNETVGSPATLGNLELYPCAAGCSATTTVVAWTHDGTWRYAQVG